MASGPSCHSVPWAESRKRPTKSEAVMSSLQATVISGLSSLCAMYSTKRVLPQPVGPLSIIGMRTE
jgi:hypothetical protein